MSHSITPLYDAADAIWVIDNSNKDCGPEGFVTSGVVVQVMVSGLVTGDTITYDVRTAGNTATDVFEETDMFADLASAITEYQTRLTP